MTENSDDPRASNGSSTRRRSSSDPLHGLPLVGKLVREADELRNQIPLVGKHLTRTDADLLRLEARLLRLAASRLEGRAQQLDRLRQNERPARPKRIQVD